MLGSSGRASTNPRQHYFLENPLHLLDISHQAKAMEMQINTHLQFFTSLTTTHLTLFSDLKQRSRIQESSAPLLFFATEMGLKIS
ncbi:hypothetical protein NC652_022280 [Populus alba x Populus x berolinensis]|nr:hypothetical protein NC652_022280 [Populus alba x Populus x berolinensis]